MIAQVSTRSLAFANGCKSTVDFARQLLTIGAVDAARRLKLAAAVTPRRSPTGEQLPAAHEAVAAAFAAGAISGAAAVTIAQTVAARDRGCSYPGCDAPTSWAQAHHATDYQQTRRTRVDDGALACTANHHTFQAMAGTPRCSTANPSGSHQPGSMKIKSHAGTNSTTANREPVLRP